MLNITMRKVGGIRFIAIGRINLSFSVSTPAAYADKLETRCETEAMRALIATL
jgi:hypothetical protein